MPSANETWYPITPHSTEYTTGGEVDKRRHEVLSDSTTRLARTLERTLGGQSIHPWDSVSTAKAAPTGPNLLDDINHVSLKSIALGLLGTPLPVSRVLRDRGARVRLSSAWSVEADDTKTAPSGNILEVDRGVSVRVQPLQVRRASGERLST